MSALPSHSPVRMSRPAQRRCSLDAANTASNPPMPSVSKWAGIIIVTKRSPRPAARPTARQVGPSSTMPVSTGTSQRRGRKITSHGQVM